MKKSLIIVFSLLVNIGFSQKYELGKVTIEELKEKRHSKDTSAVAAYLFNKGKSYIEYSQEDGFVLKTTVEAKIKIYKKDGYDYANPRVGFYVGGSYKQNVSFSKVVTYNLVNGAIEKTKIKSESEFVENINKNVSVRKIAMPNVKEGSIVEYSFTISYPYLSSLYDWDFQKHIPVDYSEYTTYIPEYYVYSVHSKGSLSPKIEKDSKSRSIMFHTKYANASGNYNVDYAEMVTKYSLLDVKAIKEEAFVNNLDNYTSSISNELVSVQFPQEPFKSFSTNWEELAKKIYESDNFGAQLEKNNYYEEDVNVLVKGLTTPEEKIFTIFNFVKGKMNWDKIYSVYCDSGVKKAYQDKKGNSAEINLMLVSMLRYLGMDANPVLISTRSNGVSIYPSRTAFNTVIVCVNMGNDQILLDATSKNALPNILPIQDLNWIGRKIKKDGSNELIDLMPKISSAEVINGIVNIDNQGQVEGQLRCQKSDYNAFDFREKSSNLSKEAYLEKLERLNKGILVENYQRENDEELSEPLIEKYNFKSTSLVDVIGDKMYFSSLFHLQLNENPFKQETRDYPIDFSFPTKSKYALSIVIPEGFQVETIPAQVSLIMPNEYGSFKFMTSVNENKIQVVVNLNINTAIIPAEDYETLKEFFKKVVEKENEKIVLKKMQ